MTNQERAVKIMRQKGWNANTPTGDMVDTIMNSLDISKASAYSTINSIKRNGKLDSTPGNADDEVFEDEKPEIVDGYDPRETPELRKAIDDEISKRITDRFDTLDRAVCAVAAGRLRSLIVSGAPGVGKTYLTEKRLHSINDEDRHIKFVSGSTSAAGLFIRLFMHRNDGDVLVLDDCDDMFYDDTALNLLKKALDTTQRRVITWGKRASWVYNVNLPENEHQANGHYDERQRKYPDRFQFNGSVIFITNKNLLRESEKVSRMSVHYQALISRSLYLDLTLHTIRDRIVRIRDVFGKHMAPNFNLTESDVGTLMEFVEENRSRFIDLSLRMMCHLSNWYNVDRKRWKSDASKFLLKPDGDTTEELVREFIEEESA